MIKSYLETISSTLSTTVRFETATPEELNIIMDRVTANEDPVLAFFPPVSVQVLKKQTQQVVGTYRIDLAFLQFISGSTLDAKTDDMYSNVEAMRTLAVEFVNRLQQTPEYKKTMQTTVEYTISDILERFDGYLCGVTLSLNVPLIFTYNFCL